MTTKQKGISKYITRERAILILCFGIALVFWILVNLSKTYTTTKLFPVSYTLPPSTSLLNNPPKQIEAEISGVGWNLLSANLGKGDWGITFPLDKELIHHFSYEQLKTQVQTDLGQRLKVLGLNTSQIRIELDSTIEKSVPVELLHNITFGEGYYFMDQITAFPEEVIVSGPKSIVSAIKEWKSKTIELNGIEKNIEVEAELSAPTHPSVNISISFVSAKAPVEAFTQKSVFVPVITINTKDSIKIFPEKIKTDFVVGLSRFDQIDASDFEVIADLKQQYKIDQSQLVPVMIKKQPPEIRKVQISPAEVEFFIVE